MEGREKEREREIKEGEGVRNSKGNTKAGGGGRKKRRKEMRQKELAEASYHQNTRRGAASWRELSANCSDNIGEE